MMTKQNSFLHVSAFQRWTAAAAAAVALAGCAGLATGGNPEDIVRQRSDAYWQARLSGDAAKAYSYVVPGYRALNDQAKYARTQGSVPNLHEGKVVSVNCAPTDGPAQRCVLRKQFITSVPLDPKTRVPIALDETWILENGQWWLFLE